MEGKTTYIIGILILGALCLVTNANAAAPTITSATLNYSNGLLVITGTDFANLLDGAKFHLNGVTGTDDVTLTTAEGAVADATTLTFTLTEANRVAALAISGVTGGDGTAVVLDVDAGAVDNGTDPNLDDDNNAVTETADTTAPTVTSATLDYNNGQLVVTFSETIDASATVPASFHLNDITGTDAVTLTNAPAGVDATTLNFTLTEVQRVSALAISGVVGGNGGAVVLDVDAAAITDMAGNTLAAADDNNTVTETADSTNPTLSSWLLDMSARTLTLVGSETLDASSIDVTQITLQNAATATTTHTLTDSSTSSSDAENIIIDLSTNDFNAIDANTGLATSKANSYLTLTSAAIDDMAGNNITAIANGAGVQALAYTPFVNPITITSPTEGQTLSDPTPTLSITVTPAAELWYNLDNEPINYTLCSSCTSAQINLAEENQDDHSTAYTRLLMHLNGNANDESGYGNNGQVHGATYVTGKFGQGLDFDGYNDYVEVQDSDSLDIQNEITLEAWVYRTEDTGAWERILSKSDPNGFDYWLQIASDDTIGAGFIDSSGTSHSYLDTFDSGAIVPLNQWTHLAFTYDGNTANGYINGQLVESNPETGIIRTSTRPINIGRLGYSSWHYDFNGVIDEVRIMNKALSAAEIKADYGLDTGPHTVVVYADTGTTIASKTRNFNIGTIPESSTIGLEYNEATSSPVPALISVPKRLDPDSKDAVFGTHTVVSYNADTESWNFPATIEPCYGYWVLPVSDATITLNYKAFSYQDLPPEIDLYKGWNLIGHTSAQSINAGEGLASINGKYTMALSYTGSGWDVFIPDTDNSGTGRFSQMEPFRGYWVYMLENTTYTAINM